MYPTEKFKIKVFYHIIDKAIYSIELGFFQLKEFSSHFSYLYDIYNLKHQLKEELVRHCTDLQNTLTDGQ